MTQARAWPYDAAEARDRSAELAMRGARLLRPLVNGERLDQTETLRRMAQALDAFEMILRHLEHVGARTRPE
jgi:hypothetical protein